MNNNNKLKCFVVGNRMPPEKLLSPDIAGSNIKGDATDMVISIPLDGAVVPHQQIQRSTPQQQQHSLNGNISSQEEIVNQSSSYITTSVQNQVTTVTSTISSPKYVFIRQTSDGNFTTSSSPYITTGDGESAGVGDIILVESMEVSNADQNFVVSTNCSDEDLTSLTWLHEKDLLKSLVQCPQTDKSSYASPIQLTSSGPISPTSDFLEESCVSEDNVSSANSSSDQGISMHRPDHSPKTVESASGNADESGKGQKGVPHQTVSFVYNRLQFGDNASSNSTSSSGSQAIQVNSSSSGIDYSDKAADADAKSNDNNNNTINNNDSSNVSNSKDSDSKSQTVSSLADKPSMIPNTIRISSLTYPNLSVNDKITGAVNTKKIEAKVVCNDVIGEQIIYEKADVQAPTAQETTIIPDTCIVSTVQQQRNQRTPQKIISTILQQTTNGSETAAKPTNILPNVSQAATNQTSPQALSAFQHFHKKYLREQMKSVEQKGCAFNGTSRSSTNNVNAIFVTTTAAANSNNNNSNNNNNNNNSNTNNNENSNNSTCFYYSDNYSNDSYGTGNTCNVSNNDTNNNYSYPYVINSSNNNNNNNGSLSNSNSHTDSNNNQHIYVGNDNNNNVSCRNRNSNEVTNGSVASLAYTQQRVPPDPPEGDRIHQLTPVKISSPIQLNCSNRLNPSKDIPHYEALSPTKGGTVINRSSTASHPTPKPAGSPKQKHPNNLPYDPMVHTTNKPPYSFSLLIFMAIEDSPDKALPVKEIYSWIVQHFPYFKNAPNGWKNSVRHNLSLNKSFQKVEKAPNMGKGSLWRVEEQHRPNLLQALTRSPFFPTSTIDKTFPYRNSPMPRTDDGNQPATPTKSNLDARLFPKLSKMIKEIVTKGSYSDSVEIDDDENHQHIAGNSAFIDNSVDVINENSSIVGDIYHQSNGSNIFNNNNNNNVNSISNIIESTSNNNDNNHNDSCNNSSNNYNNIDNHISYSSYTDSNSNNCIISNKITNCKSNNGDCSSPNSAIDNSSVISSSYNSIQRLARDCGADTMDDVNAATAMLALKHGPKIFTERFQNGSPVITSSPSEDHTYSAGGGNASTGSHSQNGSDINSNGASSDAAYESSEESHIYAISAEELEEQRRHAEGVDALLSFAMSSPSGSSLKRFAPTDDDYTEQATFIETIGNARTEIDGPVTFKVHDGTIMSPYPNHHVEVQNYYQYSTEASPAKKFKSSHKLRTKLKRKVQWVR